MTFWWVKGLCTGWQSMFRLTACPNVRVWMICTNDHILTWRWRNLDVLGFAVIGMCKIHSDNDDDEQNDDASAHGQDGRFRHSELLGVAPFNLTGLIIRLTNVRQLKLTLSSRRHLSLVTSQFHDFKVAVLLCRLTSCGPKRSDANMSAAILLYMTRDKFLMVFLSLLYIASFKWSIAEDGKSTALNSGLEMKLSIRASMLNQSRSI